MRMRSSNGSDERKIRYFEIATIIGTSIILAYLAALTVIGLADLWAQPTFEPEPFEVIRVEAYQFGWRFIYENGTSIDNRLVLEAGKLYRFDITSVDVIHSLYIPELGLKMDAVPGRVNYLWVKVTEPGTYTILCAELCGVGHYAMIAELVVVPSTGG